MKTTNLKTRVKNGETIELDNSSFMEKLGREDIKFVELFFSERINKFVIALDGSIINSFKTFSGFSQKVDKLIEKWSLA